MSEKKKSPYMKCIDKKIRSGEVRSPKQASKECSQLKQR